MEESVTPLKIASDSVTGSRLSGEVKLASGTVNIEFLKAIEALMEEHKISHVHLYWDRWEVEAQKAK